MLYKANRLTWKQTDALDRDATWYVLPISSLEQHGPHLPVGTDDLILDAVLKRFEARLQTDKTVLVLPSLRFGNSVEHFDYPGTVSLPCRVLIDVVAGILDSLTTNGFKRLVIVNSHGGNTRLLHSHAQEWAKTYGAKIYNVDFWESTFLDGLAPQVKGRYDREIHAGEIETSMIYHEHPELREVLEPLIEDTLVDLPPYFYGWGTRSLAPNGVMGYASLWSDAFGATCLDYCADKLCAALAGIMAGA